MNIRKKECFSCQNKANPTLRTSLEIHKRIYEQTGKVFWFFRENTEGKTKITSDAGFKIILEQIKNNVGANWCHIAYLEHPFNDYVSKNSLNKKSKVVASNGKSKKP